jgi:hypothetical protein
MEKRDKENRPYERMKTFGQVTLISPHRQKVRAFVLNVSLSGLLISEPSSPLDPSTRYIVKIHSPSMKSIYVEATPVRLDEHQVGMKITRFYLDSKELLEAFIEDLKTSEEFVQLLDEGWLDHLFVDDQGNQLTVEYI